MPELPEVAALVADLGRRLVGRTVDRLEVTAVSALKTFDPPASALSGKVITGTARYGKYLDLEFGPDLHVVMHLARAGWVKWREGAPPTSVRTSTKGPLAARLILDDGAGLDVTEAGTKKGLAIHIVRDTLSIDRIATLGPDPLASSFTVQVFASILERSGRTQIKGLLRNQSAIAGIGNAYSDEILHVAKMSPFAPASMDGEAVARLYDAVQSTLREAISRSDGVAAVDLKQEKKSGMRVHGRTGLACPVCGDTVREVIFADSTLQYCATCQTNGKPLADRVLSRLLK